MLPKYKNSESRLELEKHAKAIAERFFDRSWPKIYPFHNDLENAH